MSISAIRSSYLGQNIQRKAAIPNGDVAAATRRAKLALANGSGIAPVSTVKRKFESSIVSVRGEITYGLPLIAQSKPVEQIVSVTKENTSAAASRRVTIYEKRFGSPVTVEPVKPSGIMASMEVPAELMPIDYAPVDDLA